MQASDCFLLYLFNNILKSTDNVAWSSVINLELYTVFSSGSQVIFVTGLKISDIYLLHLGARHIHHGVGVRGGAMGARASSILKRN